MLVSQQRLLADVFVLCQPMLQMVQEHLKNPAPGSFATGFSGKLLKLDQAVQAAVKSMLALQDSDHFQDLVI